MAYASALLILLLLLLLLFWFYPISIPLFSSNSTLSFPWNSLTATSSLLSPLMGQISLSHSIMSVFTWLLLHTPKASASLIISSSTWATPANDNGSISVQFLLHWHKQLLLPLFLCLLHLYLKPQLWLTSADFQSILSSFDKLTTSDLNDVLSLLLQQCGQHLHLIWVESILELLCNLKHGDPPLDFFLHIGGAPMIVIGDIIIHNDVQTMILQLLKHVGSPTSLMHCSHQSHAHWSQSSLGSCTGTFIDIPTPTNVQASISSSVTSILLANDSPSIVPPTHQPTSMPGSSKLHLHCTAHKSPSQVHSQHTTHKSPS